MLMLNFFIRTPVYSTTAKANFSSPATLQSSTVTLSIVPTPCSSLVLAILALPASQHFSKSWVLAQSTRLVRETVGNFTACLVASLLLSSPAFSTSGNWTSKPDPLNSHQSMWVSSVQSPLI